MIDRPADSMSHRILVNSYIASARAHSETNSVRLEFLENKRAALSEEVEAGDWEAMGTSFDGSSSSHRRHVDAMARLSAVMEAIEILTADSTATKRPGGILIPNFHEIPTG